MDGGPGSAQDAPKPAVLPSETTAGIASAVSSKTEEKQMMTKNTLTSEWGRCREMEWRERNTIYPLIFIYANL